MKTPTKATREKLGLPSDLSVAALRASLDSAVLDIEQARATVSSVMRGCLYMLRSEQARRDAGANDFVALPMHDATTMLTDLLNLTTMKPYRSTMKQWLADYAPVAVTTDDDGALVVTPRDKVRDEGTVRVATADDWDLLGAAAHSPFETRDWEYVTEFEAKGAKPVHAYLKRQFERKHTDASGEECAYYTDAARKAIKHAMDLIAKEAGIDA